jgi:cysteine desulfurase
MSDQARDARTALRARRDHFVETLRNLPWGVTLNGPSSEKRHPGNANVCFHGFAAQEVLNVVQPHLAASTGSACTSGIPAPSHVLRAIGMSGNDAESSIRFSLGFSTTDEESEDAVVLIAAALERLA